MLSESAADVPRRTSEDATISNYADVKELNEKEDTSAKEGNTPASQPPGEDYPDGGLRAWLVVFGGVCNTFSTFGYVNAWGAFQAYYTQTVLRDSSPSNIAWIGSLQYALIFLPGLVIGRLFDIGYFRVPFLASSILLVVTTFLVAECTEYWQFLLCQGLGVGIACGGLFGPTLAVIAHWFKHRRGLAMGFVAVGSSIGGTIFPIAVRRLIDEVGFPWTMRIIGFILILTLGLSNLTLKRRLPPKNAVGGLLNLAQFKSAPYTIYCLSSFVTFLGLYTVLTYIDISAVAAGLSEDFSFYLVSIANASSGVGRIFGGHYSDRWGPANVMIPLTAGAGILTYAWPFARTEASLIVIAILYGVCSGAYVSLLTNPLVEMGGPEDVGRRIGMFMSILSLGALCGPPISGAINVASGGFNSVGYFAGTMVLLSVVLMCVTRYLILRSWWGKF